MYSTYGAYFDIVFVFACGVYVILYIFVFNRKYIFLKLVIVNTVKKVLTKI